MHIFRFITSYFRIWLYCCVAVLKLFLVVKLPHVLNYALGAVFLHLLVFIREKVATTHTREDRWFNTCVHDIIAIATVIAGVGLLTEHHFITFHNM